MILYIIFQTELNEFKTKRIDGTKKTVDKSDIANVAGRPVETNPKPNAKKVLFRTTNNEILIIISLILQFLYIAL